jgi:integrase
MLRHLTRISLHDRLGIPDEVYVGDDGQAVDILPRFTRWLHQQGLAPTTVARYAFAAARFVDYLIELSVFARPCCASRLADAIDWYPLFLRDGAAVKCPDFPTLPSYATQIGCADGLSSNASVPTIAAVNRLLVFARDDAARTLAVLREAGCSPDISDLGSTFRAIDGVEAWTQNEKLRFRQRSMMAAVVRIKSRLTRPRGLRRAVRGGRQTDFEARDFPIEHLAPLLAAATSNRDRALWSLLAGGGLRLHEALNIRIDELDPVTRQVYVLDPAGRRNPSNRGHNRPERFKGREVSRVVMFEPLESIFWQSIELYLRREFVAVDDNQHLFQQRGATTRGRPLAFASDTALQCSFKRAVKASNVPSPPGAPHHVWTPHSLRHLYGVYMVNFVPVPGGPGLSLTEVQQLMGHARIESTRIYARRDRILLEASVATSNQAIWDGKSPEEMLRSLPDRISADLNRFGAELSGRYSNNSPE